MLLACELPRTDSRRIPHAPGNRLRREDPLTVTYMDVPVGPVSYYTGAAETAPASASVTVTLDNATVGE